MDSLSARHASDETAGSPSPQTPSPERGTQIQCENVCVRFDETPVLQNVGLSVPKSEIIAILGPSGCGKTTLLRAIAGLQSIDSGDITMNPPVQPQRGHVGFVFQQPALLPWLSARENVRLPIRLGSHDQDVHDASINDQIRDLCGQVGLEDAVLERSPGQLSGGMRMRVSIARALITRPSLLLMDEPFAALDDMLRNRLCELIQSLWYEHAFTTVLVTHNISEAVFISRRVAVMTGDGSIGKILTIDEPMPRDDGFRSRPEFGEYYGRLAAALRDA